MGTVYVPIDKTYEKFKTYVHVSVNVCVLVYVCLLHLLFKSFLYQTDN